MTGELATAVSTTKQARAGPGTLLGHLGPPSVYAEAAEASAEK